MVIGDIYGFQSLPLPLIDNSDDSWKILISCLTICFTVISDATEVVNDVIFHVFEASVFQRVFSRGFWSLPLSLGAIDAFMHYD